MTSPSEATNEISATAISSPSPSVLSIVAAVPAEPIDPHSTLTRSEAAEVCGVHPDTVRRDQEAGLYPGAAMVDGVWRIPALDLVNAGRLSLDRLATASRNVAAKMSAMQAQVLQVEVAELRMRVHGLEDLVAHQDAHITTLSTLAVRNAS